MRKREHGAATYADERIATKRGVAREGIRRNGKSSKLTGVVAKFGLKRWHVNHADFMLIGICRSDNRPRCCG